MRTQEMLEQMPSEQRKYLESLKEAVKRAKAGNLEHLAEEHKTVAKGYIRALVDLGVVKDFKTVWCWFTL